MRLGRIDWGRVWPIAVVIALVCALLVFIIRADGNHVPELELHDAGVWVTNGQVGAVGRTNTEIQTVDARLDAAATDFDVLQSGRVVLVRQSTPASQLMGIDPATREVIPGPAVPDNATIALGGDTAALYDPGSGAVVAATASSSSAALALDAEAETGVIAAIEGPGALAVGTDGTVYGLGLDSGTISGWSATGADRGGWSVDGDLDSAELSVVGTTPVVLDTAGDRLLIPGRGPLDLREFGERFQLQEPGSHANQVLVGLDTGLLRVPLAGGDPELLGGANGDPARPMMVAGCDYGAWAGTSAWMQACGEGAVAIGEVPQIGDGVLRFRTNRNRITLNNLDNGNQLLFTEDDPEFIDNAWVEALSDEVDENPEEEEESDEFTPPTCESEENTDPVAESDQGFGTRPGVPVVIYPLNNDTDADCDVLLITQAAVTDTDAGSIGIVEDARALQVTPAPGADSVRFEYTVSDGRGGTASSFGVVSVTPDGQNSPPVVADEETTVVSGGSVAHNVLLTAYDPDGDVLRLVDATIPEDAEGQVRFSNAGEITYDAPGSVGEQAVRFTVSDGQDETEGTLTVRVVDRNVNQPPNARPDSITAFVGRDAELDVLDNDTDPDGDILSLVRVVTTDDATVAWEPTSPTIRVSSDRAGTVNIVYRITDGQDTDEAVLRVDFVDETENLPPIAVRDNVLLTPGVPAFVPVVDNDVDPDGAVLVVLGIDGLPTPSPIAVSIFQRSTLRITAQAPLTEPVQFEYRISDGQNEAVGLVVVEQAPESVRNRAPSAVLDEYTVRAGGVATLPVLANDSDPDGDPLTVEAPPDDQPDAAEDGRLFLSTDGELRYEAPDVPRNPIRLIYSVADNAGNVASAELVLRVIPRDGTYNDAPVAPELIGRTIAGERVTVRVPVTSMDPDGDVVTFLGLDDAPSLGTVIEVGPDYFVYQADGDAAGTDEFTYRVADAYGQDAIGTALIGVAGRSTVNNRPIAVDDERIVAPGATVLLSVLENDSDPDGDTIRLSTEPDEAPTATVGSVEIVDNQLRYRAPEDPEVEQTSFRYVVADGRGLSQPATVTITFQTDLNNRPPRAVDDTTEPQAPETVFSMDLLDNDEDPDDDELTIVEVSSSAVTISPDGQDVSVVMPTDDLVFTYLVSDGTDEARAAVLVPVFDGETNRPPVAGFDDGIEVDMGDSVTIDVLANDTDPDGDDVHLLQLLEPVRHGEVEFDGEQVTFTASEDNYAGDAGFYYVVGDADDPSTAATAVGAVRITIVGTVNAPHTFTELEVEVPAAAERTVDLTAGVVDVDEGAEYDFGDLDVDGDGFDVDISDGTLTVSADADAEPGSTGTARFVVSDDRHEADGAVLIRIVSSDRPLAVLGPDAAETVQTQPVTVNVLTNDTNPFPETPLRVVDAQVTSGGGSVTVDIAGTVTYDPGPSFFGDATITYSVVDATDDPTRDVDGTLVVNVIGFPDAPASVSCIGGESRVSRVNWAPPAANGAPITEYVVRVNATDGGGGAGERRYPNATTQDVAGLTNGKTYTFQIGAVNRAITESGAQPQFSAPSSPCTPDQVPDAPAAPTVVFGDGQLDVSWTAPNNEGSAITEYTLFNATDGEARTFGPTERSTTWDGLENGTCYRFTLVATNALGESPASPQSTGDGEQCRPAGVPQNLPAPTVNDEPSGARSGVLEVSWTANDSVNGNGDEIDQFRITGTGSDGSNRSATVSAADRTIRFNVPNGVDYQFRVEAQNKAGWSEPSPQSAVARADDKPAAPTNVVLDLSGRSAGKSEIRFTRPADNGAQITQYTYRLSNGTTGTIAGPGGSTVSAVIDVPTCSTVTATVTATNSDGASPSSAASAGVHSYNNPSATVTSAQHNVSGSSASWSWNTNRGCSGSVPGLSTTVTARDKSGTSGAASGTRNVNLAEGERSDVSVSVRTTGPRGTLNASDSDFVSRRDPPPPQTVMNPQGNTECDIGNGPCTEFSVSGSNWPANQSVTVRCVFDGGGPQFSWSTSTNSSGSFPRVGNCHVGVNTTLQYQVTVGSRTVLTCGRSRDQSSCTRTH